jgi:putative membrane protein
MMWCARTIAVKHFASQAALLAALVLPTAALAQTAVPGGAAGPATPPAAPGPAPTAGTAPAEIMPRSAKGGADTAGVAAAPDSAFARTAAAAGLAEARMGRLAAENTQSAQVRTFAQRMVTDHMQLGHRLTAIAERKGLTLPTEPNARDVSTLTDLARQKGADFDNAYLRTQDIDHEIAMSAFQQEAEHGTDTDLKAFAQAALPTLRQHLLMAKDAEKGSL